MKTPSLFALVVLVNLSACGANEKPVSAGTSLGSRGLTLPTSPATITFASDGGHDFVLEIAPDGTVSSGGRELARVDGRALVVAGKPVMRVEADDKSVTAEGGASVGSLGEDTLTTQTGAKLAFVDDGTVTVTGTDGTQKGSAKTRGFADAKRTALVLIAAWLSQAGAASTQIP